MLAGTTSCQDTVSVVNLSASFKCCWRMPAGVHGQAGSTPASWLKGLETLVNTCRQREACGECRRNYMTLGVPGSSPGRAFTGTIAQLEERQRRCFSTDCRRRLRSSIEQLS